MDTLHCSQVIAAQCFFVSVLQCLIYKLNLTYNLCVGERHDFIICGGAVTKRRGVILASGDSDDIYPLTPGYKQKGKSGVSEQ